MSEVPKEEDGPAVIIREVWDYNLEAEFDLIRNLVDHYPYIGMDTEYPGVYYQLKKEFENDNKYKYLCVKKNVDALKLIQLGLTFADKDGNLPTCGGQKGCVWQFNFKFDMNQDTFVPDSLQILKDAGIDFKKHYEKGIDCNAFAMLLTPSAAVMNSNMHWVTFHGKFDFAYLLKVLTGQALPETIPDFYNLVRTYFKPLYDIKYMLISHNRFHGGLSKLGDSLGVKRIGTSHQAGSDSLLTLQCFKKLKDEHFNGSVEKYEGVVYGIQK